MTAELPKDVGKAVKFLDDVIRSKITDEISLRSLRDEVRSCQAETRRARHKKERAEADRRDLQGTLSKLGESLGSNCNLRECAAQLRSRLDAARMELKEAEAKHSEREARMQEEHRIEREALREISEAKEREAETRRSEEREREQAAKNVEVQATRKTYAKILDDLKGRLLEVEQDRDRLQRLLQGQQQQQQHHKERHSPASSLNRSAAPAPAPAPLQQNSFHPAFAVLPPSGPSAKATPRTGGTRFSFELAADGGSSRRKKKRVTFDPNLPSGGPGSWTSAPSPAVRGTTSDLFGLPADPQLAVGADPHPAVKRPVFTPGKLLANKIQTGQKRKKPFNWKGGEK